MEDFETHCTALIKVMNGHVGTEHLYAMEQWPADLRTLGAKTFLGFRLIVLVSFLTSGKKRGEGERENDLSVKVTIIKCLLHRRENPNFYSDKINPQNSVWNISVTNIYLFFHTDHV